MVVRIEGMTVEYLIPGIYMALQRMAAVLAVISSSSSWRGFVTQCFAEMPEIDARLEDVFDGLMSTDPENRY